MTIKLRIEGDRILTESGVEVGMNHGQNWSDRPYEITGVGYYQNLPEAEAAYNEHLDAICGGSWYDDGLCPLCAITALRAELDEARGLYHDLLFTIATKHPLETRHETAKRYLIERQYGTKEAQHD